MYPVMLIFPLPDSHPNKYVNNIYPNTVRMVLALRKKQQKKNVMNEARNSKVKNVEFSDEFVEKYKILFLPNESISKRGYFRNVLSGVLSKNNPYFLRPFMDWSSFEIPESAICTNPPSVRVCTYIYLYICLFVLYVQREKISTYMSIETLPYDYSSLTLVIALVSLGASLNRVNWIGENALSLAFLAGRDDVAMYLLSLRLKSLNPHECIGSQCKIEPGDTPQIKFLCQDHNKKFLIPHSIVFNSPVSLLHINVFHLCWMVQPRTALLALRWSPLKIENQFAFTNNKSDEHPNILDSMKLQDCYGRTPLNVIMMWNGFKVFGGENKV
jgi:hypothetical protein